MKVFAVRTQGYKTRIEVLSKAEFDKIIDDLGDCLEFVIAEVKEIGK
jgi:hypothetical protein